MTRRTPACASTRRRLLALLAASPAIARAARAQDGPQPELPKEDLVIITRDGARHAFRVEMALLPQQQTTGLMFRREVPADGGMLFDWGLPARDSNMWMRNTITSLDMLFINPDGTIRRIAESTVPMSEAPVASGEPVAAVLEVPGGRMAELGAAEGDRVDWPKRTR